MRDLGYISFLLFLFLIPFVQCHKRQNTKRDTSKYIAWQKDHRLIWANYKGLLPIGDPHAAGSLIWFDISKKELRDSIEIHLTTYFIPDSSWYNPLKINDRILDHETRHFDLGEVFTRQFRKYLLDWKGRDYDEFMVYFYHGNFEQQALELQARYDSETNHSLNILIQEQWDKKIDSLLDAYKDFARPIFRIKISWIGHY